MATQTAGTRRRAKAKIYTSPVAPAPEEATGTPDGEATTSTSTDVDPGMRNEMVSRAAYFRAERRGFSGGSALQDWLEAEVEIDQLLSR
jgi:hypothetical protein